MIYTFYSYKGGVGRSMALANVAQWFYLQGLRVVMIDWDLEAPGLENFFFTSEQELENVHCQIGLIDMLMSYKRRFPRLPLSSQTNAEEMLTILQENLAPISDMFYPIYPRASTNSENSRGALWLIPAGLRYREHISAYALNVQDFDWADFYANFCGKAYFEWMRTSLLAPRGPADVVLIDSRTGITEMGGVCTRQLADVVVSFCVPNLQNLANVATMAKSFQREELLQERDNRALHVVVVPARLDSSEVDARNHFQREFKKIFTNFTPFAFKNVGRTFWHLKIPYIPKYAYTETLSIEARDGAEELEEAYKNLAASLILFFSEKSDVRKRFYSELRRLSIFARNIPRVFVSYTFSDSHFADTLCATLREQDIPIWQECAPLAAGRDWWERVIEVLNTVEFMVIVMSPAALLSPIIREEWRYARQQGVCVYPVKTTPDLDFSQVPRWMSSVHCYDLTTEQAKFLNDLNRPGEKTYVPFMVADLPSDFVPRPRELDLLRTKLLDENRQEPTASTVALRGAGGYGKTKIAQALCHDEAIQEAFDDGILWVTLGEKPDSLIGILGNLIYALSHEKPELDTLDKATNRLTELLVDRDILLVIDDVWSAEHLEPFLQGGKRCARLITTRNEQVLPSEAERIIVDVMQLDGAINLLLAGLRDVDTPSEYKGLQQLVQRLGRWPLLLKLVNGVLSRRVQEGEALSEALTFVGDALDEEGLTIFDDENALDRHKTVARTLEVSLQHLSPTDRERYRELAIFPEDIDIPLTTLAQFWQVTGGMKRAKVEFLCQRLAQRSLLLEFNLATRTIRLHDVMRTYLRQIVGNALVDLNRQFLGSYQLTHWSALPHDEPYLWQYLAAHLIEAGRATELLTTLRDGTYLATKTYLCSTSAVEMDITLAGQYNPDDLSLPKLKRHISSISDLLNQCSTYHELATMLHAYLLPHPEFAGICASLKYEL